LGIAEKYYCLFFEIKTLKPTSEVPSLEQAQRPGNGSSFPIGGQASKLDQPHGMSVKMTANGIRTRARIN